MTSTRGFAELVRRLRLERWQDEDEPNLTWWHRLLAREEHVVQESYYWWESDYHTNPHWSVGRVVTWLHWGLGVEAEADLWDGDGTESNRVDTLDLRVVVGPLCMWASRRSAPNRPNVFESHRPVYRDTDGSSSPA